MTIPTNNKPMPSGLMIQDLTDRAIRLKIADACEGYKRKFRAWPQIVWMHPDTLGGYVSPNGLEIKADARIPRGYLLVGPLRGE